MTDEFEPDADVHFDVQGKGLYRSLADVVAAFFASFQRWFLMAAVLGAACGLGVAGLTIIAEELLLDSLLSATQPWIFVVAPVIGLFGAIAVIRFLEPGRSPATTEAFLDNYHDPGRSLDWRSIPAKLIGAIATVGGGGSAGLEGPSVYMGAALGSTEQRLYPGPFYSDEDKVLTVAGAAGGLSAIFRAPLTGVMFGVEGPYRMDLARFAVAPSLIAASISYLIFSAIRGTTPIFEINATEIELVPFPELLLGIVVGVVCSFAARLFIAMNHLATRAFGNIPLWARALTAGLAVGILGLVSFEMIGFPAVLGQGVPGAKEFLNDSVTSPWMPTIAVAVVLVLMKMITTALTLRSGGVGGVFFPLAFMGAGIGAVFTTLLNPDDATFYPVIGIAAMIGSAFRAPLTAVAFIAETTGSAAYLIPGLIAAAAANVLMGKRSISEVQERYALSSVTAARRRPLRDLIEHLPPPRRVPPEMTLEEYADGPHDEPALVIEDGNLVGLITKDLLYTVDFNMRPDVTVADVMDRAPVEFSPSMVLRDAAGRLVMDDRECGIVMESGKPIAVVTERRILETQEARRLLGGADID